MIKVGINGSVVSAVSYSALLRLVATFRLLVSMTFVQLTTWLTCSSMTLCTASSRVLSKLTLKRAS